MTADCPRAKSSMTPCVLRDGKDALADDGACVGCLALMTTSESPTHPDAPRAGGETPTLLGPERVEMLRKALMLGRMREPYYSSSIVVTADELEALLNAWASLLERHRDGERDTKRLDWLERAVPSLEFRDFCNGLSTPWPGTFREFVDAAMSAGPSPERASPPVNADDSRGHKSTSPCEKCGAMEVYVSQSDADDADFTIHCYACGMHYRVDGPDA